MFRSGYVAILGVPNVGKSTLLNALLGEKLAIVTPKPQTTRHRILGIVNRAHSQILFLDTPGIHASDRPLNEAMVQTAFQTFGDADVVLHLVFPKAVLAEEDLKIARKAREIHKPYLLLINRIDEVSKPDLLPLIQSFQEKLAPDEIIPISALAGDGLDRVLAAVESRLPEGPRYYPEDHYTEHDLRFLAGEIVREKAMKFLHQESPYHLATQVEAYEEKGGLHRIHVVIFVEKPSQKGMVIGAKGAMLKKIGQAAREDIERMTEKKVYLELFVKVLEDWTKDAQKLRELGILQK
jgi:GTP-binding protein Era